MTNPPQVVARIGDLALLHPAYGCNRLEALLALEGRRVSAITVQKILNDKGLAPGTNAGWRSSAPTPTRLLSADTFTVGTWKGTGRVYLHAVVDTFGSYAFGFLHVSKQPEAAIAALHDEVLPFYQKLDLPVQTILTDHGHEFCGTERHPYELYRT